jgi:hypothetical protein
MKKCNAIGAENGSSTKPRNVSSISRTSGADEAAAKDVVTALEVDKVANPLTTQMPMQWGPWPSPKTNLSSMMMGSHKTKGQDFHGHGKSQYLHPIY